MHKIYLTLFLLLTSCAEGPDLDTQLTQACTNMGAPPGNPEYYNCRMKLTNMMVQSSLASSYNNAMISNHNNGLYKLKGLNGYQ